MLFRSDGVRNLDFDVTDPQTDAGCRRRTVLSPLSWKAVVVVVVVDREAVVLDKWKCRRAARIVPNIPSNVTVGLQPSEKLSVVGRQSLQQRYVEMSSNRGGRQRQWRVYRLISTGKGEW